MSARIILIACAALGGCKSEINPAYCVAHETDPRCPDGGVGTTDGPQQDGTPIDASTCVGSDLFTVCLADQLPTTNLTVTANIDTDSTTPCLHFQPPGWVESGQPAACFVVGVKVSVTSSINARGSRPLVIVATDSLTISDKIDLSASQGAPTTIPAGFSSAGCGAYVTNPANNNNGGGGGAGGSLMTKGGDGGTGNNNAAAAGLHVAALATAPTTLRAGCIGQNGGVGDNTGGGGGVGGNGGGAVYLVAGNTITLASGASIDVSGAGGDNGGHHSGGGGAGSGGMLVMSAANFAITAGVKIYLDGGGGSSGGTNASGVGGSDPSNPTSAASGGTLTGGASGGDGFFGTTDALPGGNGGGGSGGGGGGGGGGYLQSNHPLTGAAVSPIESVVP